MAFCSWPENKMLLRDLSKEVVVIKLSLRKTDLDWSVRWTRQGMEGAAEVGGGAGTA